MQGQVKERPIIFSSEMVKAILDGKKTMTRRVVKTQPDFNARYDGVDDDTNHFWEVLDAQGEPTEKYIPILKCPYGKVGDRLWVRETHHVVGGTADYEIEEIKQGLQDIKNFVSYKADGYGNPCDGGWTSPMFMPRWTSRILLEITDIRVERLNDISEADAVKEGLRILAASGRYVVNPGDQHFGGASHDAVEVFSWLWDSLNTKKGYPWSSNPWVWVVEFKVIEVA
ncbi:MAG: hypothetical protein VB956_07195 [Moraxella sp.]